ncbi:DUF1398 family protein [uncultured Enterococcus sp.]|uniref:DUF1398 domain-containing protein n=1 Tax=uncultured Enterococcus sp. TaxID=167972 RepID=UPI002AA6D7DC|nr:DUF1398 family protein [uncultured Enterococcus sp.]
MVLDYNKIEKAIAEEKDAGGFAELIKKFKLLGIKRYDYFVAQGSYRYYDEGSFVDSQMNGKPQQVEKTAKADGIKAAVRQAQAGEIDFEEFCKLTGEAGISYWITDLQGMTVSYYNQQDSAILVEPIPSI